MLKGTDTTGNLMVNGENNGVGYLYTNRMPHAVKQANGKNYAYDANGNMIVRDNQRLDYDPENRLSVVGGPAGVSYFGYDAGGARLWKQTVTDAGTNLQVWIGGNYEEKQGKILFHVSAAGRLVATFDKAGTVFDYYHPDHLHSSTVISGSTGARVQHYEYSAFGQQRAAESSTAFPVSKRYTSQVLDEDTGLYFYGARYYAPELGRFVQPDSVIFDLSQPQSYNRYSYALNNPLRYTDPDGHLPMDWNNRVPNQLTYTPGKNIVAESGYPLGPNMWAVRAIGVVGGAMAATALSLAPEPTSKAGAALVWANTVDNAQALFSGKTYFQTALEWYYPDVSSETIQRSIGVKEFGLLPLEMYAGFRDTGSGPKEPYNRELHYGKTPTKADRKALGAGADEVVNHTPSLIERFYEGDPAVAEPPGFRLTSAERRKSADDRSRMDLQQKRESNAQGGHLKQYSDKKKAEHGLE